MNSKDYIEEAEQLLLHTYNRYQIVLDRGEGMYLYDLDGKKYLDFCAGIAVFALGYRNELPFRPRWISWCTPPTITTMCQP